MIRAAKRWKPVRWNYYYFFFAIKIFLDPQEPSPPSRNTRGPLKNDKVNSVKLEATRRRGALNEDQAKPNKQPIFGKTIRFDVFKWIQLDPRNWRNFRPKSMEIWSWSYQEKILAKYTSVQHFYSWLEDTSR